jgi:putative flippase GtrA
MAPEATIFGVIGLLNVVLYLAIFNATIFIGAVKATVIATVVTTTLSYLANRHWTYRNRPRTALRREYTLFFAFNLVGMLIQATVVGVGKYGLGFNEHHDRLELNIATNVGIALATVFRFWAYRTLVFKTEPAVAVVDIPAKPAARPAARIEADTVDLAAALPPGRAIPTARDEFVELTAALEAELSGTETPAAASKINKSAKTVQADEQARPLRQPLVTDSLVTD